jgi:predicted ArsR family transcriptional regulator
MTATTRNQPTPGHGRPDVVRRGGKQPGPGRRGSTRRALLDRLKRAGPQEAKDLAAHLGITAMAVRQHLYALEAEAIVAAVEEPRPLGRPAKLWRLTAAAEPFFPDGHAELTLGLLEAMTTAFGARGLDKLLDVRTEVQLAAYRARIKPLRSLKRRLEALAEIRSEEGYMAEVRAAGHGAYLLIENHCPVCAAAQACRGLCRRELEVFAAALGPDVEVERIDHLLTGARRCSYRVRRAKS